MRFYFRYFFIMCLILFAIFFTNNKDKYRTRKIGINYNNSNLYRLNPVKKPFDFESSDSRVRLGKTFLIKDDNYWYQIYLLTFWREEFLNLGIIDDFFSNNKTKIKIVDASNYGLRHLNNDKIVYACLKDANKFYYHISHSKFLDSSDYDYWKKIYMKNIRSLIYKFKPTNYECLLVITSNKEFFEVGQKDARNLLLDKFTYSSDR